MLTREEGRWVRLARVTTLPIAGLLAWSFILYLLLGKIMDLASTMAR